MRLMISRTFASLARHPHRPLAFLAGMGLPLLIAGLMMVPRLGGLSDTPGDNRPPAFVVSVD